MAVLIDASILIESERGRLALEPHLAQRQQEEFFRSVVTASELLHGVYRAAHPESGPGVPLSSRPSWSVFLCSLCRPGDGTGSRAGLGRVGSHEDDDRAA
jgi:hypothetical protein